MTFVFLLAALGAAGASARSAFARGFSSPRLRFDAPGDQPKGNYPAWARWLFQDVLGREPDSHPKAQSPGCRPDDLDRAVRSSRLAPRQAAAIEAHLRRCGSDLETDVEGRLGNLLDIMRLRLNVDEHPLIERVTVRFPDGSGMRGLLALKGDRRRRPFVVVRLGVFSSPDEDFAEKFLLMQLFEQGPFNVLVLGSVSGAGYEDGRPGVSFAGGVEALQNLQLAKILRDPAEPLSALVGSLHFVGISLGGHGLFATAAFDPRQPGGPRIDSFTALCPVADLKGTLGAAANSGFSNVLADLWISLRLRPAAERTPELRGRPWGDWLLGRPAYLRRAIEISEKSFDVDRLSAGLTLPPEWSQDVWSASRPWPWFRDLKAPFLIIATEQDTVVPMDLNFAKVEALLRSRSENVGFVKLRRGFHCTLPAAYDWNTMAAMLNGALLASDRSWQSPPMALEMDLGDVIKGTAVAPTFEIDWPADGRFVIVRVHVAAPEGPVEFSMNLPVSGFDFHLRGPETPEPVRRTLRRWLHRNLSLKLIEKNKRAFLKLEWPKAP